MTAITCHSATGRMLFAERDGSDLWLAALTMGSSQPATWRNLGDAALRALIDGLGPWDGEVHHRATGFAGWLSDAWRPEPDEIIYFIREDRADGYLKIGRTTNLPARMSSLRSSSPHELELLATEPGGEEREREIHQAFSAYRVRGEWFRPEAPLLAFIASRAA